MEKILVVIIIALFVFCLYLIWVIDDVKIKKDAEIFDLTITNRKLSNFKNSVEYSVLPEVVRLRKIEEKYNKLLKKLKGGKKNANKRQAERISS